MKYHADIIHDLAHPAIAPVGYWLYRRGVGPSPCQRNRALSRCCPATTFQPMVKRLKRVVTRFAELRDSDLGHYIRR